MRIFFSKEKRGNRFLGPFVLSFRRMYPFEHSVDHNAMSVFFHHLQVALSLDSDEVLWSVVWVTVALTCILDAFTF